MKTSEFRNFTAIAFIMISALTITGCNELSQGIQRQKFEFLYRINTEATLLKDYTNGINKTEDLDFFERRLYKFNSELLKINTIDGYEESKQIKQNLITLVEDNIASVNTIKMKQYPPGQNIRQEYEVLIMKEKIVDFLDKLNDEIVKTGKE